EDPLAFLQTSADVRIQIPDADIAALAEFLPDAVLPAGRAHLDVALKDGALSWRVDVKDVSTRPLVPVGALRNIQVGVELRGPLVVVESVSADMGGETLTLTGEVALADLGAMRQLGGGLAEQLRYALNLRG